MLKASNGRLLLKRIKPKPNKQTQAIDLQILAPVERQIVELATRNKELHMMNGFLENMIETSIP